VRDRLEGEFERAVVGALGCGCARAPCFPLRLAPAVRETLVAAAARDAPEAEAYYTRQAPPRLVDQLYRAEDPGARLLWRRLSPDAAPRLVAALRGVVGVLRGAGLSARALLGAATAEELLAARPTVAALAAPTLFGSGMPLIGAQLAERAVMARDLDAGMPPDDVIDLRLSGNLVHEICHGLQLEYERPPPPWTILEAAAIHLGATARPAHVFPEVAGEAVPGVSLFVLVGEGLARLFGAARLWSLLGGATLAQAFGEQAAELLEAAGWQAWRRRREAPFVADALDAMAWIKLAAAAVPDAHTAAAVSDARAAAAPDAPPVVAGVGGSIACGCDSEDLLGAAERAPWRALGWWHATPTDTDVAMVETAVRALFQVNVLAPTFQTHPADPPGRRLFLDVDACTLSAPRRAEGVAAEPARWLFPPPLARRLAERGARTVTIEGAVRARRAEIAAALAALALDEGPLSADEVLAWTSSP
jgi:hypothetical protein